MCYLLLGLGLWVLFYSVTLNIRWDQNRTFYKSWNLETFCVTWLLFCQNVTFSKYVTIHWKENILSFVCWVNIYFWNRKTFKEVWNDILIFNLRYGTSSQKKSWIYFGLHQYKMHFIHFINWNVWFVNVCNNISILLKLMIFSELPICIVFICHKTFRWW